MNDSRPLRYFVEVAGHRYEVREIEGREAISKPFRFELGFALVDTMQFGADLPIAPIEPDDIVKTDVTLHLERDGIVDRVIHGLVFEASLGATLTGVPDMHLVIEPRLSLLQYRTDIRVFRNKTAPEIVVEVLSAFGITPELRLRESYESRPYCVQFRESDFNFVSRLLEDEGIFYYFNKDGVMILGDSAAAYDPIPGNPVLPYRAGYGMDQKEDAIVSIGSRASATVGKVTLRDFNPDHPSLDMDVDASGPSAFGPEWYDYPGEYAEPSEGKRKVALRSEAFACASEAIQGRSICARILPGHTMDVFDVPEGAPGGELVVTVVDHAYRRADSGFSAKFEALFGKTIFRPLLETPIPQMTSPLTGIVTCPPGEDDIYTEEAGRVKIHFHWDRLQPYDGECSHWVPVVQDNTGHSVAIPRRGWEMLVHFLEGDPDRPVVIGRVYNAEDRFPVPLPEGKTKTSLKSLVTPSRDGTNEIQFEDYAGREHIYIHAEKDQNIVVGNDKSETTLVNELSAVYHDERIAIGINHTEAVGKNHSMVVVNNQSHSVGGNRERQIGESDMGNVTGNRSVTIGGSHIRRIHTDDSVVAKNLTETVGAVDLEVAIKTNSTEANTALAVTVGGAIINVARQSVTEAASKGRLETIGGVVFSKAKAEMKARADKNRVLTVGGTFSATVGKEASLTGAEKIRIVAANEVFDGSDEVMLKVGDTTVVMKEGTIAVNAPSKISLKITGSNKQGAGKSTQI